MVADAWTCLRSPHWLLRALLALWACAAMCAASRAQGLPSDTESPQAGITPQVLQSGVFQILGELVDEAAPRTAAGRTSTHEGEKLLRSTRTLRATKGVAFGFKYRLRADRDGPLHGLEMQVLHPPMRGVDGKAHTVSAAPTDALFENSVSESTMIYTLSEDWEVLPGVWTVLLLFDGRPLISRSFRLEP